MNEGKIKGVGIIGIVQSILLAIGGIAAIFLDDPLSSLNRILPNSFEHDLWACILVFGAILTIFGILWTGRRISAYAIEQVGQLIILCTSIYYLIGLLYVHGAIIEIAYASSITFAIACRSWKLEVLKRDLVSIQRRMDRE